MAKAQSKTKKQRLEKMKQRRVERKAKKYPSKEATT